MMQPTDGSDLLEYARPVAGSTIWSLSGRVGAQTIQAGSFVALAHLAEPHDFGIVAIAAVFIGFAQIFTDLGLGPAIVARAGLNADFASTATVVNLVSGVAMFAIVAPLGWPLSLAFGNHALVWVIPVAASTFVVSVSAVNLALLERRFRFRAIALAETISALVGQSTAIGLAVEHHAILGLSLGPPVSALTLSAIASVLTRGWGFAFVVNGADFRGLVSYAGPLVGANTINYWGRNVDNLLIAKLFNASSLAFYSRAYQLMVTPVMQLTLAWGRVLQASYAHDLGSPDRLARKHALSQGDVAYCGLLATAVIVPMSAALTHVVFGDRWAAMGPLLAILSASIAAQVVTAANGALLRAASETRLLLRLGLLNSGLLVVVLSATAPFGVTAVAIAFSVEAALGVPIVLLPVCRRFHFSTRHILREYLKALPGPLTIGAALAAPIGLFQAEDWGRLLLTQTAVLSTAAPFALAGLRRRNARLGL